MVPDFDVFIIFFPLNADWNVGGEFWCHFPRNWIVYFVSQQWPFCLLEKSSVPMMTTPKGAFDWHLNQNHQVWSLTAVPMRAKWVNTRWCPWIFRGWRSGNESVLNLTKSPYHLYKKWKNGLVDRPLTPQGPANVILPRLHRSAAAATNLSIKIYRCLWSTNLNLLGQSCPQPL